MALRGGEILPKNHKKIEPLEGLKTIHKIPKMGITKSGLKKPLNP